MGVSFKFFISGRVLFSSSRFKLVSDRNRRYLKLDLKIRLKHGEGFVSPTLCCGLTLVPPHLIKLWPLDCVYLKSDG